MSEFSESFIRVSVKRGIITFLSSVYNKDKIFFLVTTERKKDEHLSFES